MAQVGGMLAAAILKVVGDQIGSAIGGQITLQMNFDEDLNKMKMALESVDAVLKVAGRLNITDEPTCLWLRRLTDAMYDISSLIDDFEADTSSARKFSLKKYLAIKIPCIPIGPKIKMANKMKKMRQSLEVITDQHTKFQLPAGINTNEPKVTDTRETWSILETQIIERPEEKGKILDSLSDSMTENITILPIYGIGGLGKTTLAKMVYHSSQFKEYSHVWVYVSQTFDLKKIGNSIISQLKKKESRCTEMQMINNSLQELLTNKKILIVLDDLWEDNISQLEKLKDMMKVGDGSSVVVIVTTRTEDIANKICTIDNQPHKLASLTHDQCWTIIKKKCDFESRNDQEELQHIGKEIANKCRGVALAAQSLGHMLHFLRFDGWELVRKSGLWNEDTGLTPMQASLKLSYGFMRPYLKICFAYCAIFPKGYKIVKDDLIHQWISLGFIKAANKLSTWLLGEECIKQLLGMSFLEHSKSAVITETYVEDTTLLTMHDLVHDLARSVMDKEILVVAKGDNAMTSCYHYALSDDCSKPLGLASSKIRALRFMNCDKIKLDDAVFSSAKSLRVLDLSDCTIFKLTDCIGELKQLRYLNAPRVQDAKIPDSITRLSKLLYLNLHGSSEIVALPESIGDIEGLAYLDLSGCSEIAELPESFRRLNKLVHLDLSNCSRVGGISVFLESLTQLQYLNLSYCPYIGDIPEALGGLTELRYLNLSYCAYLESREAEYLGVLTKLEYLNLYSASCPLEKLPEDFGRLVQLKYLNLSGCKKMAKLPRSFGNLKYLVHLDLSYCKWVDCQHEALVGLTNLQYLNLKGVCPNSWRPVTKFCYMSEEFDNLINHISSNLSNLEHLDLSGNNCITCVPENLCNLTKLHMLNLSGCFIREEIPESIRTIGSLVINGCDRLSRIPRESPLSLQHFLVRSGDDESSSNLVLLQPTDPIKLKITELENVKSAEEARRMKLMEKQRLKDLKLKWTRDVPRFVDDKMLLEELVPPSTLKNLEIRGYSSASLPAWLVSQLPNLESLILRDMPNLKEWNTSYSSGEEHVIHRVEIHDCPMLRMKVPLPKAKSWKITWSDNVLSSPEECDVSHMSASSSSPVTTMLSATRCKGCLHQWRLLKHFPGISSLCIDSCGDLTGSPEITQHLSYLEKLQLGHAHMKELPEWLGELTSLRELDIDNSHVKEFNENRRQLTMLQSLRLFYCPILSLPHWLGELTSLNKLYVNASDVLRSLPESIQQLTNLQEIAIINCHKLEHVVAESKKGKMKLTRNKKRVCVLPTSLKDLHISGCEGIKCLPVGIQQLTNLQDLCIIACPELKQWCELEENKMKLAHIENKEIR